MLLSKATCFADPEICGNFEVNDGEQCDAGPEGDACCDSQCMLIGQCRLALKACTYKMYCIIIKLHEYYLT